MNETIKQVTVRLPRKERLEKIKQQIVEVGLWNLPSYRDLGKEYGITHAMICKDINKIVSTFDPKELDKVFTEFYNADKKSMNILREIIHKPQYKEDMKMKAIDLQLKLQKGVSELLESFAKKQKAIDRVQVEKVNYHITIDKPYEEEPKNVTGPKDKLDTNKEATGSVQDT